MSSSNIYVTRPIIPPMDEFMAELKTPWDSAILSNFGPKHKELESALRDRLNVLNISLFVNGTIALMTAIQGLRLSGEVITTPFTFPATIHALAWNNITPVFCDIKPDDMTIDPDKIRERITAKTTAIMGVHLFGNPCDVISIRDIADEYGLKIIYDAAHAFGVEINDRGIGEYGDISMFSFHPTKLFHTGEGGALTFWDSNLYNRFYYAKNFGIKSESEVVIPGINGKMNEISAALGLVVLRYIDDEIEKRKKVRQLYYKYLSDEIEILKTQNEQFFIINSFTSRESIWHNLRNNGIYSRRYFYPLNSSFPCYNLLPSADKGELPNAVRASESVLALPFYGDLNESEVERICTIIKKSL